MALTVKLAVSVLALSLLLACESSRTEIIVLVDSDLSVPAELDQVNIVASRAGAEMATAEANLTEQPLPRTLGLEHRGGPLGPVDLVAVGRLAGQTVVQRGTSVSFIPGKTRMLRLLLLRECQPTCPSLGDDDLEDWSGEPPPLNGDGGSPPADTGPTPDTGSMPDVTLPPEDTGAPAVDGCQPSTESCNGLDDDCDGVIDNGFDLMTDPNHCGGCTTQCGPPDRDCCNGVCGRC